MFYYTADDNRRDGWAGALGRCCGLEHESARDQSSMVRLKNPPQILALRWCGVCSHTLCNVLIDYDLRPFMEICHAVSTCQLSVTSAHSNLQFKSNFGVIIIHFPRHMVSSMCLATLDLKKLIINTQLGWCTQPRPRWNFANTIVP